MWATVGAALAGAGSLGALLTPVLLHMSSRRQAAQVEAASLIDQLQQERDRHADRGDALAAQVAALFDYVWQLRRWIVKGADGDPPTMPPTLTVAAVRARAGADA